MNFDLVPYTACNNRVYRKTPQLNRPLVVIFDVFLCNHNFTEKNKIRFLQQLFRWFYKDALGYRIDAFSKNDMKCNIVEGDFIRIVSSATKAPIKHLLKKLNYELDDYKLLKRRKYTVICTFYFTGTSDDNNLTLDIHTTPYDTFHFFFTTSMNSYMSEFIQLLCYYYLEEYKE